MGYCTRDDVIGEFRGLVVSTTTVVTTTLLDEWIAQASQEIDARLSTKFQTPVVAGVGALSILKTICIWLVAPRVASKLGESDGSAPTSQPKKSDTAKDARSMLSDIVAGKMNLPGASLLNSSGGVSSFNASSGQEHQFKRNEDQW